MRSKNKVTNNNNNIENLDRALKEMERNISLILLMTIKSLTSKLRQQPKLRWEQMKSSLCWYKQPTTKFFFFFEVFIVNIIKRHELFELHTGVETLNIIGWIDLCVNRKSPVFRIGFYHFVMCEVSMWLW